MDNLFRREFLKTLAAVPFVGALPIIAPIPIAPVPPQITSWPEIPIRTAFGCAVTQTSFEPPEGFIQACCAEIFPQRGMIDIVTVRLGRSWPLNDGDNVILGDWGNGWEVTYSFGPDDKRGQNMSDFSFNPKNGLFSIMHSSGPILFSTFAMRGCIWTNN